MKKHPIRILLGLAITAFFIGHAAQVYQVGFIRQLDNIIYDARLNLTMPRGVYDRVVILDIDEKSLGEIGRWPWSRNVMARLVDQLFDRYGVKVLGFDVVFAERDTSSGMEVLDGLAHKELKDAAGFRSTYQQVRPQLDFDGQFAASIKGRPVILGYYFSSESNAVKANAIAPPVLSKEAFLGRDVAFYPFRGYTGNLPELQKNAAGAGHFNPMVDDDGVSRRVPLVLEFEGAYYEALSLAIVRNLIAQQTGVLPAVEAGFPGGSSATLEWFRVADVTIPVDDRATVLIPYRGEQFSFPFVSLADVLKDRIKPDQLRGKVAIIGTTAPGLKDLRSTPVGSAYAGVEVHANMIAGMMEGRIKSRPPYILGAEVALLFAGGVALTLVIPMLSALGATAAAAGAAALFTGLNFTVWSAADVVLPLAASILMIAFLYTMNMAYGYFVESRSKRQFTELFGQYVPPELVDRMAADPQKYSMEPKAAELTILFSDVRGFTGISEMLKPEELREYINEYLTVMSGIIRARHRGTLDKYIGDAIMAFWGAPVEDPQHARNGVLAGLDMQRECKVLNAKFAARGWPTLKIGVGLNSGNVRVGDMGSQVRRAYTVMGDAVNVASRLEGRTKLYGVGILCGERTRAAVADMVFREVDRIKVKGKDEAVTIYEPLGPESEAGSEMHEELGLWNRALGAYRKQQWDEVESDLAELRRKHPDRGLYSLYAERVAAFRRTPPAPGWDGVTAFDEK